MLSNLIFHNPDSLKSFHGEYADGKLLQQVTNNVEYGELGQLLEGVRQALDPVVSHGKECQLRAAPNLCQEDSNPPELILYM